MKTILYKIRELKIRESGSADISIQYIKSTEYLYDILNQLCTISPTNCSPENLVTEIFKDLYSGADVKIQRLEEKVD